ncbi:MAG: mandelate racemase/muconate lactonizing enzyme family protein [Rhodospirillaceae bacterium]|nr:mandelate racemase/muconate lactonizing enzyme family protein [Rhodospirillaceae bacterium]
MSDLAIDRIQVYVVAPETQRYAWADGMPEQYMSNTILRLTARGGLEGVAGAASCTDHLFDTAPAEALRPLLPALLGATPHEREALWHRLRPLNTPIHGQAQSLIDIALWDAAAKAAGLPLHRMLGGARTRILSYASTPLLEDAAAYVDFVDRLRGEGFKAVKFHCWCDPAKDLPMVEAVQARHGGAGVAFMLDVEQRYDRAQALRAGRLLSELGWRWFEAPLLDFDLEGYAALRSRVDVPVIPAGNWILDPALLAVGIRMGCWSSLRVDATICGGITPTRWIMGLAQAHGMTVELQCWGYTLTQAANLHLMLAYANCTYFEQPTPYPAFEHGALDVIRTDGEGYVHAPEGPGLGIRIDWEAVEKACVLRYELRAGAS